ncbi:MAG: hypothetical protein GX159_07810 [Flavobacteriaceae bacterium]|nr:hypothetical protein [Flavobacteriaceae bacterium]
MRKFFYLLFFSFLLMNTSCFEDLFGIEDDDEYYSDDDSSHSNASYEFTYQCPGGYGSPFTVTIPAGSTQCQNAYEYFAKVYGCNDYDNFNEANCKMCYDCGIQDYCTVCE